jgi:hypothetical protein
MKTEIQIDSKMKTEIQIDVQGSRVQGVRPLVDKRWYNQVSTGNPY